MAERCEMCGDEVADGGSGRLHDTYDCAGSLLHQRNDLRAKLTKFEAERDAMAKVIDYQARALRAPNSINLEAVDAAKAELEKLRAQGEKT